MRTGKVLIRGIVPALLGFAALLAVFPPGCGGETQDDTLIVLEVDSNLAIPAQLDTIDITVTADSGSVVARSFPVEGQSLPVQLALVPEGDPAGAFSAKVVARAAGRPTLSQEIRSAFLPDQARRLAIYLGSECLTVTCPDQQTCRGQQCMAASAGVRLVPLVSDAGARPPPPDACPGLTCDGTCVDSQTDRNHCGACNTTCEGSCRVGTCEIVYKWLAIVENTMDLSCATSSSPGADIDAIEAKRGGAPLGVGLKGSASFVAAFPGAPPMPGCPSCFPQGMPCRHSGAAAAAQAEGPRNARNYPDRPDTGYISLNGGAIWLQLGNPTGDGPPQLLKRGDTITVHEVDKVYIADGSATASCLCSPEKYTVWAYREKDQPASRIKLTVTTYHPENKDCGPLNDMLGCGTTTFTVP